MREGRIRPSSGRAFLRGGELDGVRNEGGANSPLVAAASAIVA